MIARNCDWFMALFVRVVIGRSNCFVLVFRQSFENRSIVDDLVKGHNIGSTKRTGEEK